MQVKSVWSKDEAVCEHDAEMLPSSLSQSSSEMIWGKMKNLFFRQMKCFLEIMDAVSVDSSRVCISALVLMAWAAYTSGKLPEEYIGVLEKHMLQSR